MKTIRYENMIVGSSNQSSILRLSDYESCQFKEVTAHSLAEDMFKKSNVWIIDGEEVLNQVGALWELLKELRELSKNQIFIHLVTHHYDYWFMRSTSITDEILDMCDVLTDRNHNMLDLRATCSSNDIVYWEVS